MQPGLALIKTNGVKPCPAKQSYILYDRRTYPNWPGTS
jgi:hypothetical protein